MELDQRNTQRIFAASIAVFLVFLLFVLQVEPIRTLDSLMPQFELAARALGSLGDIVAAYVVWRMYHYFKDTEFGRVALLVLFGVAYLALASLFRTVSLLDTTGLVTYPPLGLAVLSLGRTYFTLFKGAFILLGFTELARFLRSPRALPTLMVAFKRMLETESGHRVSLPAEHCEAGDGEHPKRHKGA
jgi:hypothetical protein